MVEKQVRARPRQTDLILSDTRACPASQDRASRACIRLGSQTAQRTKQACRGIGVDLISDVLPFGRLWYDGPNAAANAVGYAMHYSRSHDAVIGIYMRLAT